MIPLLELKNIYLYHNKTPVLQNVSFNLFPGEIHALVGEHRAGKTLLIKIISGELKRASGEYYFRGQAVRDMNPQSLIKNKIGVIYQEPRIIPNIPVLENILAGTIPPGPIKQAYLVKQIRRCRSIMDELGLDIRLETPMAFLSPARQQMVELARVYYLDCDVLILDDIGSRLTPGEMGILLKVLKRSRKQGKAIIIIDSDVDNVMELADRVTILNNGVSGGTEDVRDLDRIKLLKLTYNFALNQDEKASEDRELEKSLVLGELDHNRNLMANLPAGVIILNKNLKPSSINATALRILEEDDFTGVNGKSITDLIKKEDLAITDSLMETLENHREYSWDHIPFRQKKFLRIKTMPFKDSNGDFGGSIIMLEEVAMENSLKEYLVRAEKISSIAELAAGVSHEINNPLGIINNYLQILLFGNPKEATREKLEKIAIQLKRITEITSSLLSFSKFKQLPNRYFDLKALVEEVILLLSHQIKVKKIRISKHFPKGDVMIRGSENRIRQVFVNLVNNGIEASTDHGHVQVEIKKDLINNYVEVLISDNGCGIPLEIQKDIFSPFFSTKIKKENAGLGLSICQHILDSHKGFLSFSSVSGEKTTFVVKLPMV